MIKHNEQEKREQERLERQAQAIVDLRRLINNCGITVKTINPNMSDLDSSLVFNMKKDLVKEVSNSVNENVRKGNYQAVCFNDLNSIKVLQEKENQRLQEEYLQKQAPEKEKSIFSNITILGLITQTIFSQDDKLDLSKNLDVVDAFKSIKAVTSLNELNSKIMNMIESSLLSQGDDFAPFVKQVTEKSIVNPGEDMASKLNGIQKMINEIIEKNKKDMVFRDEINREQQRKESEEISFERN